MEDLPDFPMGLEVEGEFADVKYENSDHGIIEYIKRTALSNPHAEISFVDPEGQEHGSPGAVETMPERPEPAKPHPLGLYVNDLLEYAHSSPERKISSFLKENFSRVSDGRSPSSGGRQGHRLRQGTQAAHLGGGGEADKGLQGGQVDSSREHPHKAHRRGPDKARHEEHIRAGVHERGGEEDRAAEGRIPFIVEAAVSSADFR